ncbi:STAS domain-containing protein [Bacillus sp. FJAT-42376]|uniref:STAS domain-containing protein n=1 Tax=Bacillus sp. FJAT-42376 TaxID=2014076 RepID=UPI000F513B28|nr:STAS domain-containing protein [Bacillus sp. FJAT-42376]AZB44142.1 STAS domain-containing protein [Bacillus sp. FJAT-42376]
MNINQALRDYFNANANRLTEDWYSTLENYDSSTVYGSKDPEIISGIKAQNLEFHHIAPDIFIEDKEKFMDRFYEWVHRIARDGAHLRTPNHFVIKEFKRTRKQYIALVKEFIRDHADDVSWELEERWINDMTEVFDTAILKFVEEAENNAKQQLKAQQEMIYELSSPVISLANKDALLPLVGDIDTARAKIILENTLEQCSQKGIEHLFIDLSGVVIIDTMVAQEIFQLIDTLALIGVKTTISGIRPEIAMTAMQLGLSFEKTNIRSTLSQAIASSKRTSE